MKYKLTFHDTTHRYHLNGVRAKSVTAVAKMAADSFALDAWAKRQVAKGMMLDPRLCEQVALDPDNKDAVDLIVDRAMATAGAHDARERGSQRHRASELADTGGALLTEQQRRDAEVWGRTMDAYGLTVLPTYVEQFVIWPQYRLAGKFDRICGYRGRSAMVDLKSGENAVRYPHSTAAQLSLYTNAPLMSDGISRAGDLSTMTAWREIPEDIDREWGYVVLITDEMDIGQLWRIGIKHGYVGALTCLDLVEWRKKYNYGADLAERVGEVTEPEAVSEVRTTLKAEVVSLDEQIDKAESEEALVDIWRANEAQWTEAHTQAAKARKLALHARSLRAIEAK